MCYSCHCVTDESPCEPCKMTIDVEKEEAHVSNEAAVEKQHQGGEEPHLNISSSVVRDRGRNWGWMVSGIICVNVLILGCALVSGSVYNKVNISPADHQIFLIILLLLTIIWMVNYVIFTARKENAVDYKDAHAGPVWLRGGLVLFGILSIIMDIFKIATYVGYLHCDSAVKVAFPVVQLVFIIVQTYFLWVHAKDCVQLQKNITRCGLMLTLSTNLVVWMTAVTDESMHQTIRPDLDHSDNSTKIYEGIFYMNRAGYGDDKCKCSYSTCSVFKEAYYYLYPFNIEYSLFASAMAYVMWKNVGRATDEHGHHGSKLRFTDALVGPLLGILLVIGGLTTFIMYEIEMKKKDIDEDHRDKIVTMHFVVNIVIVTLMSVCTVVGSVIYRLDRREHMSEKNPTRNLDVGLLVGASMGQIVISYFTIVAMVGTGAKGHLNRLNLAWGILMVIQLGLQNFFIIEGLHREPFHEVHPVTVMANPYIGNDFDGSGFSVKPIPVHHREDTPDHRNKLSWKRRVLKEVCAFLMLGNIILWIMPAFGARPQFDQSAESDFYQFQMWAAVVNIGLPFGIFYRMHSVASVFEVFLNS